VVTIEVCYVPRADMLQCSCRSITVVKPTS
jgi:hypothetical protein